MGSAAATAGASSGAWSPSSCWPARLIASRPSAAAGRGGDGQRRPIAGAQRRDDRVGGGAPLVAARRQLDEPRGARDGAELRESADDDVAHVRPRSREEPRRARRSGRASTEMSAQRPSASSRRSPRLARGMKRATTSGLASSRTRFHRQASWSLATSVLTMRVADADQGVERVLVEREIERREFRVAARLRPVDRRQLAGVSIEAGLAGVRRRGSAAARG